ncbi:TlpA disulfide reductase family protein [Porticoccaceae bacterium LTM1]|nr:TlpA disulfide reductase family protein [Porticoccaceae bacterium LTM1]
MRIVKLLTISLSLICSCAVHAKINSEEFAIVRGKISAPVTDNNVELQYVENGKLEAYGSSLVDQEGRFAFMVPVKDPGFFRLNYADRQQKQLVRLYLQAGLDLSLEIDETSQRITGSNIGHNKLVLDWNNQFQAFHKYTSIGGDVTYEDFYPFLEETGLDSRNQFLEKLNTGDKQFDELMTLAVNTDFEAACYRFLLMPRSKHPEKGNYPQVYFDWQKEQKFTDARLLNLGNGCDLMQLYFTFSQLLTEFAPANQTLSNVMAGIASDSLKEVYLYEYFSRFKSRKPPVAEYYQLVDPVRHYLQSDRSKSLLLELEKDFQSQVGQPGFNFICEDAEGNPVAFESFKGKVVYLDVWATWCGPCKSEIPHLKKLEHALQGEDIVFVSISTDADKDEWLQFIEENEMSGVQLHADGGSDSGLSKNYEINTIPRFLLFDKEGKIVDANARRPSSPELKAELLKLIRG